MINLAAETLGRDRNWEERLSLRKVLISESVVYRKDIEEMKKMSSLIFLMLIFLYNLNCVLSANYGHRKFVNPLLGDEDRKHFRSTGNFYLFIS